MLRLILVLLPLLAAGCTAVYSFPPIPREDTAEKFGEAMASGPVSPW